MSHLWNPLATAQQLGASNTDNALPGELQDSIRYSTAKLTQAASILLRLPQDIAAQAIVVLMRFWVVEKLMQYEFSVSNMLSFS
jgi:cyclin L